ncbi:MAG: TetR/AcrR family transcriptional regulator [Prevotellaceae bacterium]|jgi:AcrR family transcriptional regulator|nr:TetR/AcrR family transcriptional regulator [Prevotellaceae bacterium]
MLETQSASNVKERILQVSRELFVKNGYNGVSVRDIATASGTNVAHLNYYFQSKYNLFELIFEEAFNIMVKRIFAIIQSDKPFFDMIECWINAYYDLLMEYPQIPLFVLNEINQNPDRLVRLVQKQDPHDKYAIIAGRVEEEVKKGTIKATSTIDLGLNVVSLCIFPFIFGKFAMRVADISFDEYRKVLEQHKLYVIRFVTDALKP